MPLQPHLKQAIAAEIAFLKQEKAKQQLLSPNELRAQGWAVFPLECKKASYTGQSCELQLQASFHINDTHFYRGCKVLVHVDHQTMEGRLREITAYTMEVVIQSEEEMNPYEGSIRIDFEADDKTLKCMELGLRFLEEKKHLQEFEKSLTTELPQFPAANVALLNESQRTAVGAILSDREAFCIQGPPGTGKTTILKEAIQAFISAGKQVIVCAPSNTAVDHLCLRLREQSIPLLRLGNDEKIHSAILPFTIDGHIEQKSGKLATHLQKSIQAQLQIVHRFSRNFNAEVKEEKKVARNELRALRTELRQLQKQVFDQLISDIPVIAGTPVALFHHLPKEKMVDLVVIDEAGQCLSPLAWLAASFGKRLVLCGDPQQLPPIVFSPEAVKLGLNESLLEASCNVVQPMLLQEQYRFGASITAAINPFFYSNALITSEKNPESTFYFIDTAGFGDGEAKDEISGSTFNTSEVEAVEQVIAHFSFSKANTVLLSPYNAQLEEISKAVGRDWKVSTIDSMQGQEADNCIISLTRSNENGELGFLKDYRRTNVAISRARKTCVVIGDSATLGGDDFYNQLIQYAENSGTYKSIYELIS